MSDDAVSPEAIQNGYHNAENFSLDQDIAKLKRENDRIKVTKYSPTSDNINKI